VCVCFQCVQVLFLEVCLDMVGGKLCIGFVATRRRVRRPSTHTHTHTHTHTYTQNLGARPHPRRQSPQEQPIRFGPDRAEPAVPRGTYFLCFVFCVWCKTSVRVCVCVGALTCRGPPMFTQISFGEFGQPVTNRSVALRCVLWCVSANPPSTERMHPIDHHPYPRRSTARPRRSGSPPPSPGAPWLERDS